MVRSAASVTLGVLAGLAAAPVAEARLQSQDIRTPGNRDLSNTIVIGLLSGHMDYSQVEFQVNGVNYGVVPTENAKPFAVLTFRPDWIELKLKENVNDAARQSPNIAFRFFDSELSLYRTLLLDQVDYAVLSNESLALEVQRANPNMLLIPRAKPDNNIQLLVYNMRHDRLQHREIRQAISFAVNRKKIIERVLSGKGNRAEGSIFESDSEFYPRGMYRFNSYRYNRRRAIELLENNGWKVRDRSGIRERSGQKLRLNLALRKGIRLDNDVAREVLLACADVGIEINPVELSMRELRQALDDGSFDMVLWEKNFTESIDELYSFFTAEESSFIKFRDDEYFRLYALAKRETDYRRRLQLAYRMQEILNEESVVTFLFFSWWEYVLVNGARITNVLDPQTSELKPMSEWQLNRIQR